MPMDPNVMGWDDALEDDGKEFIILPEGDYTFTVTGFERGQYPGGNKIPPCPKATVTMEIENDLGYAMCRKDFFLYRTMEWLLTAFFRCIGMRKHGEKAVVNWNEMIGRRGRAHFRPRSYTGRDGTERQANDAARFIDYEPGVEMTPVTDVDEPW